MLQNNALLKSLSHRSVSMSPLRVPLQIRLHAITSGQALSGLVSLLGEDRIPMIPAVGEVFPITLSPDSDSESGSQAQPPQVVLMQPPLSAALFPRAGDLALRARVKTLEQRWEVKRCEEAVSKIDEGFARRGVGLHVVARAVWLYELVARLNTPKADGVICDPGPRLSPPGTVMELEEKGWIEELHDAIKECEALKEEFVSEVEKDDGRRWELRWRVLVELWRRKRRIGEAKEGLERVRDVVRGASLTRGGYVKELKMEVDEEDVAMT
jgi:hypothetical protein